MNAKITISLIAAGIAVCLFGYIVIQHTAEEHPEHNRAAHSETADGVDEHADEELAIELTPEEIREISLETATAGPALIETYMTLSGEIRVNEDRMAHVVPRVEGVVTEVEKTLGDAVKAGEVIAVIESRDLADAKAGYLAAVERYEMAKLAFGREEKLWNEKISSEQDYLDRKQGLTEARIDMRSAEQKLHAIGFGESYLEKLNDEPDPFLTRFEITAPFEGTIIEKHIVLGELVKTDAAVFVVADLSSVWVDLHVYPKDLGQIKTGQEVVIFADSDIPNPLGTISYIGPTVGAESRTATARIVLANESGAFRPGLFITARAAVAKRQAKVVVAKEAIQTLEGRKCVFIKDEHGFEPAFVELGLADAVRVEILSGIDAGQDYVTTGSFSLKSKIVTSTLDSHAGHGH